jgi:hypothetical protein
MSVVEWPFWKVTRRFLEALQINRPPTRIELWSG